MERGGGRVGERGGHGEREGLMMCLLCGVAVPVGQSPDDGLSYTPNPRFDEEGRWRPRSEWPKELQ